MDLTLSFQVFLTLLGLIINRMWQRGADEVGRYVSRDARSEFDSPEFLSRNHTTSSTKLFIIIQTLEKIIKNSISN